MLSAEWEETKRRLAAMEMRIGYFSRILGRRNIPSSWKRGSLPPHAIRILEALENIPGLLDYMKYPEIGNWPNQNTGTLCSRKVPGRKRGRPPKNQSTG